MVDRAPIMDVPTSAGRRLKEEEEVVRHEIPNLVITVIETVPRGRHEQRLGYTKRQEQDRGDVLRQMATLRKFCLWIGPVLY